MNILLLGARGAVGSVIRRELECRGHSVTTAGRTASGFAGFDLNGDLAPLASLSAAHDVVVNASGIERVEIAQAVGRVPLVEISATGAYLDALRTASPGAVVLGAGLAPGLSTILVTALDSAPGDEIDVFVMLGSGEVHGPAAVAWTAGLVGTNLYRAPEGREIPNLRETRRATGPDGRERTYLRADFPDHILLGTPAPGQSSAPAHDLSIRSYLSLTSAPLTSALRLVGRLTVLRGALGLAPHVGSHAWHVVARNRRTGEQRRVSGFGQSESTGKLAALSAIRLGESTVTGAVTMADLVDLDDAVSALPTAPRMRQ